MTGSKIIDPETAKIVAQSIRQAYDEYQANFHLITQRSKIHFEDCNWRGAQFDAVERLELYKLNILCFKKSSALY